MLEMLESLSAKDIIAVCALLVAALIVFRSLGVGDPPAASESRKSRVYDPKAAAAAKEHWDRLTEDERDARERALDALPDFPGVPASCPMCTCPTEMPKHCPPGTLWIHDSDAFQVRRPGHMAFHCGGCGYSWSTKTASHDRWPVEEAGEGRRDRRERPDGVDLFSH